MSISAGEYKRRYAAIRELMQRDELDCLLVIGRSDDFNRGNIRYISGSGSGGVCVFPLRDDPVFFTRPDQKKNPKFKRMLSAYELLDIRETAENNKLALEEITRFYNGNRIGVVGMPCISVPMYQAVSEKFTGKLLDCAYVFDQVSMIKSDEEIEKIRIAAGIADKIYAYLREIVHPGVSEYEIYGAVKKIIYESGCEYSFDLIDGYGSMMNMSFFPTADKLVEKGTLFFEITPAYEGYYAQLPVTLPVGEYSPLLYKMVSAWAQSDEAVKKVLRPGKNAIEVYNTLVKVVRDNGFISPHEVGHDLGLDAHGSISIDGINNTILQPGMVLAIHASVMQEIGSDGCGMGYTYLITENGAERFSRVNLADDLLGGRVFDTCLHT